MVHRRLFDPSSAALRIGRFRVLEEIGRGGMGVVYSAYDDQLDRKVALKVLRDDDIPGEEERQRLRREAQALARLSHPNVVSVHEVGEDQDTVFVAMEFIRGSSVMEWLEHEPEAAEVLDAFVQAGRGLMAAHAEGLVHRDFKPHNMMRSEGGVVKVLDFGLARADASQLVESVESSHSVSGSGSALASELTRKGTVMGTPAYMAPEQHQGAEVDARTDQYSFCLAVWEGLAGARPFAGRTLEALLGAKVAGPPPWPSSAPAVPRAVVNALSRGLATDPAERWPSMEPLLEVLARDRGPRRARWLLAGATVLVLAVGAGAVYDAWATARAQICSGAERQLDGIWDEARRGAVEAAIMGVGKPYAPAVLDRTVRTVDEYAGQWAAMHTEACEATTVRGEQSGSMMDLRMACLHRAAIDLQAVVETLEDADDEVVTKAHTLVGGLRPVSRCADTEALVTEVEPPRPEEADAVEAARWELAKSKSLHNAGRYDAAREAVAAAKAALDGVGYEPVRTEVSLAEAIVLDELGDYEASEAALTSALERASRWRQWNYMQFAADKLVYVVGAKQHRPTEALRYIPLARGLAFGQPKAEAGLQRALGIILATQGKYSEAEAELRAALALFEGALGPEHLEVAQMRGNLGNVLEDQGKYAEAEVEFRAALALSEVALGPEHPSVAMARSNLGTALLELGESAEAEVEFRAALALWEAALGPEHPDVAIARTNLGNALDDQGKHAEAEAEYRAALSLYVATLGPEHPEVAGVRMNLGIVLSDMGKHAEAEAEHRAARSLFENALGPEHPAVAMARHNLGNALDEQGKYAEAEAEFHAALSLREAGLRPDHPATKKSRRRLGAVLEAQGKVVDAEPDGAHE